MKTFFERRSRRFYRFTSALAALLISTAALAEGPAKESDLSNPLAIVLLSVIIALLLAIGLLANVVLGAAQLYWKKKKEEASAASSIATKVLTTLVLCLLTASVFAQDKTVAEASVAPSVISYSGLSAASFYALIGVVTLELIVILIMLYFLKTFLREEREVVEEEDAVVAGTKEPVLKLWWSKMNSFKPIKEEAAIDLGHNYDGIRELDNRLPPWWLYGFYVTIVFACIYLYRYHIAHTAPLSVQELQIAMEQAEKEKEAYLAKSANKVDENTVVLLTDASALKGGKKIFTTSCAPCHGADGGGVVGPNLTDDYWLHGGSIQDVFKTIKYGWADKGMKSWKDDFSPVQIAQIASYVKSLHGTRPATPKEPQGELFKDNNTQSPASTDSAKTDGKKIASIN